ncbi:uncharacterized protein [Dermacentor albipictus]|uniref:uncharacterized protein n=1 Tax=Dermacentor albipictus TaxID=60249 RepID=UPI0038FC78E3
MECSPVLTFQVSLLLALPAALCATGPFIWKQPPDRFMNRTQLPALDGTHFICWRRGSSKPTASTDSIDCTVFKRPSASATLGHNTVSDMECSPVLTFQTLTGKTCEANTCILDPGRCCACCWAFVGALAVAALSALVVFMALGVVNIKLHYVTAEARKGDATTSSASGSDQALPTNPAAKTARVDGNAPRTTAAARGRNPGDERVPDPRLS